jgi:hypothetical protein
VQPSGVICKFVERFLFPAKLNQINAAFDHLLHTASGLGFFDIAEIDDPIEAAFVERPHYALEYPLYSANFSDQSLMR